MDDVDAEIQAVTEMLGEVTPLAREQPNASTLDMKNLLTIEHRQGISVGNSVIQNEGRNLL